MGTQTDFESLPFEMQSKIFTFLPFDDKKSGRLVSKAWFNILNTDCNNELNLHVLLNDANAHHVKRCSKEYVSTLHVQDFTQPIIMTYFRSYLLPSATRLILGHGNTDVNVMKFLRYYCCNVEQLELGSFALCDIGMDTIGRALSGVNWVHMKQLSLVAISRRYSDLLNYHAEFQTHVRALEAFLKMASIPSLQQLNLALDYGVIHNLTSTVVHPFEGVYRQFYKFLDHHREHDRLKTLELVLKGNKISSFEIPQRPGNHSASTDSAGFLQLDSLTLNVNIDEPGPYIFDLLNGQTKLTRFELNSNFWFVPVDLNEPIIRDLLPRNSSTLESVHLNGISYDLTWLDTCFHLQSLQLVLVNTNALSRIPNSTKLQFVRTFSLMSYFGSPNITNPDSTREQILEWIVNNLRNVVELDLYFRCDYIFTVEHFTTLAKNLKKVQLVTLFQPDVDGFDVMCAETVGLSSKWILKTTDYPEYAYQVTINRKLYK